MDRAPLRGAVLGFGYISSQGHVPAYLKREPRGMAPVEITAVADICEARRIQARSLLPKARIYSDFRELLASEKGALDFVDVAAPPSEHCAMALAGLRAGLHVLCEKPLAISVLEASQLLNEARERRRVLFPCHNYKHAPVIKKIREVLQTGMIGPIHSVTLHTLRNTHAKGVPEWRPHWRRERRYSGGGIAMDHGSHSFYLMFEWLGSFPTSVTARAVNRSGGRFDNEDYLDASLGFPAGTAQAHLSWTAGVRKVLYTLQGTKGAITVEDDEIQVARMVEAPHRQDVAQGAVEWQVTRDAIASDWMDASHVGWFNSLFDSFAGCIERGEWVNAELIEAYRCVEIIDAIYRSSAAQSQEQALVGPQ